MKINEILGVRLGSKQHAELIAKSQEHQGKVANSTTVGKLFAALKKSTMSQQDVDSVIETVGKDTPSTTRLNTHDLSQICTIANVDEYEVFDLVGMEIK